MASCWRRNIVARICCAWGGPPFQVIGTLALGIPGTHISDAVPVRLAPATCSQDRHGRIFKLPGMHSGRRHIAHAQALQPLRQMPRSTADLAGLKQSPQILARELVRRQVHQRHPVCVHQLRLICSYCHCLTCNPLTYKQNSKTLANFRACHYPRAAGSQRYLTAAMSLTLLLRSNLLQALDRR